MEIVLRRLGVQFKEQQINKVSTGNTAGSLAITSEHSLIKSQEFEDVIVAAGAGSLKLLASSGFFVHSLSNVWGETLVCPVPHLSNTAYGLTKMKIAATVLAGQLRLGSSSVAGEGPVLEQMHQSRLGLSQQAAELFEVSNNSVRFEAGLRLKTKSRLPMIGELWFDPEGKYRLRVATGFYKNGLQFSDIAACFHVSQVLKQQYRGPLIPGTNEPLQILAP
jgi:glycine/D-amino acid oxidase-like deaminating enzyme